MDCVIYGTGTSFLGEVLVALDRGAWNVVGFVIGGEDGVAPPDDAVAPDDVPVDWLELPVVIPVLTSSLRRALVDEAIGLGFTRFPPVVDPTAIVAPDVELGEGCFVNAGAIVASGVTIGSFAVVNRAASIGHDGVLAPYASVGPGATTCGSVAVGGSTVIGAGSVVVPGRSVGAGCVVSAGSVVLSDVPDGTIVRGNPAEVIKTGLERDDTRI